MPAADASSAAFIWRRLGRPPDCGDVLRLGLPLLTLNDKHFKAIRGLRVVRLY